MIVYSTVTVGDCLSEVFNLSCVADTARCRCDSRQVAVAAEVRYHMT